MSRRHGAHRLRHGRSDLRPLLVDAGVPDALHDDHHRVLVHRDERSARLRPGFADLRVRDCLSLTARPSSGAASG